jgi:hypothetical protein
MEHRDDCGKVTDKHEIGAVRKLAEERALDWFGDDRKLRWILTDPIKHDIEFGQHSRDEPWIALAVPPQGLVDVPLRARLNDQTGHD